ncbi:hypothetical protein T11_10848 [Trichinella zimbabwensis]|uniref:Uncharacterized protein n=1 Tax=Trichinella zimbabwensis TaxID=268475 RepID=A0A0V1H3A8_9BILA|nr:hypothetical protein T11_10848 [Trichinella zimbabwensis]
MPNDEYFVLVIKLISQLCYVEQLIFAKDICNFLQLLDVLLLLLAHVLYEDLLTEVLIFLSEFCSTGPIFQPSMQATMIIPQSQQSSSSWCIIYQISCKLELANAYHLLLHRTVLLVVVVVVVCVDLPFRHVGYMVLKRQRMRDALTLLTVTPYRRILVDLFGLTVAPESCPGHACISSAIFSVHRQSLSIYFQERVEQIVHNIAAPDHQCRIKIPPYLLHSLTHSHLHTSFLSLQNNSTGSIASSHIAFSFQQSVLISFIFAFGSFPSDIFLLLFSSGERFLPNQQYVSFFDKLTKAMRASFPSEDCSRFSLRLRQLLIPDLRVPP